MNDYERRVLDCAKFHMEVSEAARAASQGYVSEYYTYTTRIPLNAVASQSVIPIQADSDFALVYISLATIEAGRFTTAVPYPIQITDTGEGKDLFSSPANGALVTGGTSPLILGGYAAVPFMLPFPRIIPRNTNVKIDIPAPTPADVWVTLTGARIAYRGV